MAQNQIEQPEGPAWRDKKENLDRQKDAYEKYIEQQKDEQQYLKDERDEKIILLMSWVIWS